jgi:hypothetical protein
MLKHDAKLLLFFEFGETRKLLKKEEQAFQRKWSLSF